MNSSMASDIRFPPSSQATPWDERKDYIADYNTSSSNAPGMLQLPFSDGATRRIGGSLPHMMPPTSAWMVTPRQEDVPPMWREQTELDRRLHELDNRSTFHNSEQGECHIPRAYYEEAQRTLATLITAGTFMASVEAQSLTLVLTAEESVQKSASICFCVVGLLASSFTAMYCAVTLIWLKSDWKHGPKRFHEWVAGSLETMIIWSGTFLVVGVYSGFFGVILYLFTVATRAVAIFSAVSFLFFGVGPMSWGFVYWIGLYKGWMEWKPTGREDAGQPKRRPLEPQRS